MLTRYKAAGDAAERELMGKAHATCRGTISVSS
jgi:hypothetical protein